MLYCRKECCTGESRRYNSSLESKINIQERFIKPNLQTYCRWTANENLSSECMAHLNIKIALLSLPTYENSLAGSTFKRGKRTTEIDSWCYIWCQSASAPKDPEKRKEIEDLKDLIEEINRNTAAQVEQIRKGRQERRLPERELTKLDLLLQKWEQAREALLSPAPEKGEPLSAEEQDVQPMEREVPPAATVKGKEHTAATVCFRLSTHSLSCSAVFVPLAGKAARFYLSNVESRLNKPCIRELAKPV
ncbi:hypothetical protein EOD39_3611 [Acipenser ruthenus]|uniref:Uncharacterized protein n=1 Tax=Acipenser ruthenus TaxID=7906 RepID=A0A444UM81_ACIRT|nr:hypothetical protein EOD39_3611 [Acipenser ruthenus]